MSDTKKERFFALCADTGDLIDLGMHADWYKAEKFAVEDCSIEVCWLLGEDSARQWKETISEGGIK